MDQHLSWGKAYIVSAGIHFVIFLLLAIGLAVVVAEQEQQVYEIDLQASDFSQGSGHEGGGSSENLFPEPLKAEEVAKRVETVQQTIPPITPPTEAVVPTPEAITVPQAASSDLSQQVHLARPAQKLGWMTPPNRLSHWLVLPMCCSIRAKLFNITAPKSRIRTSKPYIGRAVTHLFITKTPIL